jgi:hypothetical protein
LPPFNWFELVGYVIDIVKVFMILNGNVFFGRSQWPRRLSRWFAAANLLRFWVRIPLGTWKFVYCDGFVLSRTCLCEGLIARQEEIYRTWYVIMCDLETSILGTPWPAMGRSATEQKVDDHGGLFA